jgi:flagellar basal body-associated protein FliL
MTNPIQFYTQEKQKVENELASLKKRLFNISIFRLVVFFTTVFGIYYFFSSGLILSIVAVVGFRIVVGEKRQITNRKKDFNL